MGIARRGGSSRKGKGRQGGEGVAARGRVIRRRKRWLREKGATGRDRLQRRGRVRSGVSEDRDSKKLCK